MTLVWSLRYARIGNFTVAPSQGEKNEAASGQRGQLANNLDNDI